MRVRLLGTAAGGAFPQWNCNCACCRLARSEPSRARPRTQSSVAVSAGAGDGDGDGEAWFLLNCSPDVRAQIESFPPLLPRCDTVRGTGIEGVLLTDADLDHTLGLFILREGRRPMPVYATPAIRAALCDGLKLDEVMSHYVGVDWREPPGTVAPLRRAAGAASELSVSAFKIAGSSPRYARSHGGADAAAGSVVGYRIVDRTTGGRLVYAPHVGAVDDTLMKQLADCDLLLFDGTCWSDDELARAGVSETTARQMGHVPVGGDDGSLRRIAPLSIKRKVYLHLNNTNPMLIEDSAERREVLSRGIEVGFDGMELVL